MNYYIFALITAFLFGIAPIFGKLGLEGINPTIALGIRSLIITSIMLVWLIFNNDIGSLATVELKSWVLIALEGVCAALLGQLFYYYALKSGEASIVVPLIATFPLITFIIAIIFLGDKFSFIKAGGIIFVVLGVVLLRI